MIFLPVAVEPVNAILSTPDVHQRRADVARAVDDLQHRLLRHDLGERVDDQLADRRRVLARLEHDRVAGGQRVRDRAHRREDRVVPRADHADHAERLVFQVGGVLGEHQRALDLAELQHPLGVLRGPRDVVDRGDDLDDRLGDRLAALGVDQLGDALDPVGQQRRPAQQAGLAAVEAEARPPDAGRAGARDGGAYRRRRRRPGTGPPPRRWRGWWR